MLSSAEPPTTCPHHGPSKPQRSGPAVAGPDGRYPTGEGHMTRRIQQDFLQKEISAGRLPETAWNDDKVVSLQASTTDAPLYFWQVFSLTGRGPIMALTKAFYDSLFTTETDLVFRNSFARGGSAAGHAMFLGLVLMDAFGGGRYYAGGDGRLDHVHSCGGAAHVMDQQGAELWTKHMRHALAETEPVFQTLDPRLPSTLRTFLRFYLGRYADAFGFDVSVLDLDKEKLCGKE